jgi:DNA-binding MarR family transcriptional regulator
MSPALRDELRQTRPFKSLEQEAYLNLLRTAAVLTDAFELVLKPVGITTQQFNVLRILRGAEPDGLCRNELRDRMLSRMPDMTRLLDRMEEAGLVTRERGDRDRRLVRTHITPRGLEILASLDEPVAAEHARSLGHLTEEQLRMLVALLTLARGTP